MPLIKRVRVSVSTRLDDSSAHFVILDPARGARWISVACAGDNTEEFWRSNDGKAAIAKRLFPKDDDGFDTDSLYNSLKQMDPVTAHAEVDKVIGEIKKSQSLTPSQQKVVDEYHEGLLKIIDFFSPLLPPRVEAKAKQAEAKKAPKKAPKKS